MKMAVRPETSPLHGYTVVELSTGTAGAYRTKLLADGGAQVVKVESPEGGGGAKTAARQ